MVEESLRRNHDEQSWGAILEAEVLEKHLGGIWELPGKHLGGIWELPGGFWALWGKLGEALGGIWERCKNLV